MGETEGSFEAEILVTCNARLFETCRKNRFYRDVILLKIDI